jgi:putative glutathione S-transferase
MGKLIAGQWITDDKLIGLEAKAYSQAEGKFIRGNAQFRNWVTVDGSTGPTGVAGFKAEAGRYHLYGALNCIETLNNWPH